MRHLARLFLLFTFATFVIATPFFEELGPRRWRIGNELWSIEIGEVYGTKLLYQGKDLAGEAKGFYAGYGVFVHQVIIFSVANN